MAVTIMEALQNAEFNLTNNVRSLGPVAVGIAQRQLHNAVALLEKGYGLNDEVEPLLQEFGSIDRVPNKA